MDLLSSLEVLSTSLETSLRSLGIGLIVATAFIVVGLLIEYWPDLRRLDRRQPNPDLLQEVVGGILVTLAIAGELLLQFQAFRAETTLRYVNDRIVSELNRENLLLAKQVAPRRLTPENIATIKMEISTYFLLHPNSTAAPRVIVTSYSLDAELLILGTQIESALISPQLELVDGLSSLMSIGRTICGITVTGSDVAFAKWIRHSLSRTGLAVTANSKGVPCGPVAVASGGNGPEIGVGLGEAAAVRIFVGAKPVSAEEPSLHPLHSN